MKDFKNAIIECVPNFSEGVNMDIINSITTEIQKIKDVKLLDVDPGKATNRTVVTIVGHPQAVVDAAFLAIKKASELIDMRQHKGEHPRMGATDVCPLVPISGISIEDTIAFANQLGKRVGWELGIPVYLYEYASVADHRRNLADIRSGEYEGFHTKITKPEWVPDYGRPVMNEKSGVTAIGVREFLIAYNVNLNTTSTRRANSVAFDVREKGRQKKDANGKVVKDENGEAVWEPGMLKAVKGIGWYIEEYGIAQISMNLTSMHVTPLHVAFDACCERATARGLRVTGSELVGLVPLEAILEAGRYFLRKQQRSLGIGEEEIIKIAVKSLGLNELTPFDPKKKIIEYRMQEVEAKKLIDLTVKGFAHETASESPAPGGGSISAYCGALGAALGTMVANLSSHKKGWDSRWENFSNYAVKGQQLMSELLGLVDEDTAAFNEIMSAFSLPKGSDHEKAVRKHAIEVATINAIKVPFRTMEKSFETFDLVKAMVLTGNPNSVSDAGVGALCIRAAVKGCYLNIKINAQDLKEHPEVKPILEAAEKMHDATEQLEQEIWQLVMGKMK